MKFEQVPIRGQRFEIGRTISPFKCDCKECTFMNCPKHNYAVKMKRRIPTFNDFWECWGDKIIECNSISRLRYNFKNQHNLILSENLINEIMDCISFPKGLYWDNPYNRNIELVRLNRKGNIVKVGEVGVEKGQILDCDLSKNQERVAKNISKFIVKIREKLFDYYENKFNDYKVGWLSPEGRLYICGNGEHSSLAKLLGSSEINLEYNGWVKIFTSSDWYSERKLTAEQRNFLRLNGYDLGWREFE